MWTVPAWGLTGGLPRPLPSILLTGTARGLSVLTARAEGGQAPSCPPHHCESGPTEPCTSQLVHALRCKHAACPGLPTEQNVKSHSSSSIFGVCSLEASFCLRHFVVGEGTRRSLVTLLSYGSPESRPSGRTGGGAPTSKLCSAIKLKPSC